MSVAKPATAKLAQTGAVLASTAQKVATTGNDNYLLVGTDRKPYMLIHECVSLLKLDPRIGLQDDRNFG